MEPSPSWIRGHVVVKRSNQTPIPKISSPWKISFVADAFKCGGLAFVRGLKLVKMTAKDKGAVLKIKTFSGSPLASFKTGEDGSTTVDVRFPLGGTLRHKIELIHHREEGDNYSLSVWVDNKEVGKTFCSSLLLNNLTDVRITWRETPAIRIRDLMVLET